MAQIRGSSMVLVDSFADGADGANVDGPGIVGTMEINGTRYVYVPSDDDDAIAIFSVDGMGELTFLTNITDTAGVTLDGARQIEAFEVGGNPFLAVSGINDDGVTIFALTDSAPYATFVDRAFDTDNASFELDGAWTFNVTDTGSSTVLTVAGYNDDGISSFLVGSDGTLTNVANITDADDPLYNLNGTFIGETLQRFSSEYVMATGEFDDGLSLFRVNTDGSLTHQTSFEVVGDYIEPTMSTGVQIGNDVYIFAAGVSTDEVYLFRLDGFATVELVQRLPSPLLDRVLGVRSIVLGDEVFFAVASLSDEGITLFRFNQNFPGLEFVQSIMDNTGQGELSRTHLSAPFEVEGKTFIIASGENDNAINVYEIGGADDVLTGTQIADDIRGGGGDDQINGLAGDDVIDGGDGSDIINAGSGIDYVYASTGNDRTNGGSNFDTLDMTLFDGEAAGVLVDMFDEFIVLPGGERQFATGFEKVIGTAQRDEIIGDEANNDFRGNDGNDTLRGRLGDDVLRGGDGSDYLVGGDGDDTLLGQAGNDTNLNGGAGNDLIMGGTGDDGLYGDVGDDVLNGEAGNDVLRGHEGNDTLIGGAGNDDLRSAEGDDDLLGGDGNDYMLGGSGADTLNGGAGADTMTGGTGADVFVFDTVVSGGGGFNTVKDYTDGSDRIDLSDYAFANFAAVSAISVQETWGVRISLADGQTVALEGTSLAALDAGDFIL